MSGTVRSAARVLDVLEYLAGSPEGASLSDCVAALELPKSSTHMLLRTVLARGYVARDQADRYRLNDIFRTHGFGWGGHRFARLIALATPVMTELCERVGESVLLGGPEKAHVRTLAKIVSKQVIRYDVDLGTPSPFYCTAMGRVIVAFSPDDIRETLLKASPREKITPFTVTEPDRLNAIIEQVRHNGFAISEEEFALGGTGIAAPIFGADGAIFAVLDVGCVTSRFHVKRDHIIRELLATAKALSQLMATK